MGEVYLAKDETLERNVALKVLPPELVRSEERIRRFVLEAKSASSLNHPHIVTIYEVGEDAVHGADGDETGETVHYIAMELVSGKTLGALIHQEKTDLRTLLGYLAQAAEGLAKAHAAGIVHRDLKPGNIMVTTDGYAKVLDFGLAKLTERATGDDEATSAPTEVAGTQGGMVMGTVGYMAPEQIQAKSVDQRADVFAFGCILYEAATRARPFTAESDIETMHKVLHEKPQPIDEIRPDVPAELRRVIKRCMAKGPEQRLQSIKDLAIELREIVEEYDSMSASATSGTSLSAPVLEVRRRPGLWAIVGAVGLVGVAGILFGVWSLLGRGAAQEGRPFSSIGMSVLLGDPDILETTLSRDGRYLAYVKGPAGRWSLWVRQVATGSDVPVLPEQPVPLRGLTFSPDGNYLYYLGRDPETPRYSALFEIPSLGGAPRKRLFDVDTAVTFSPDGEEVAFIRGYSEPQSTALMVADLAGGEERRVATVLAPDRLPTQDAAPAWSPDGERIAAVKITTVGAIRTRAVVYDVPDGTEHPLPAVKIPFITALAWLPDGSGLLATGPGVGTFGSQVYITEYPGGDRYRITTDVNDYNGVSVSADGGSLATLRTSVSGDVWTVPLEGDGSPRQVLTGSGGDLLGTVRPTEGGTILYGAAQGDFRQVWAIEPDGSGRRPLTDVSGWIFGIAPLPGDRGMVLQQFEDQGDSVVGHIVVVDRDGGSPRYLAKGTGEALGSVSPDGSTVLFTRTDRPRELWKVSTDGGEPELVAPGATSSRGYSPDGKLLAYARSREIEGRSRTEIVVIPAEGGEPVFTLAPPGEFFDVEWFPDSSAITYVWTVDGVPNLWKHSLSGGDPVPLTRFRDGRIGGHSWAPDGEHAAFFRRTGGAGNVWVVDRSGGEPRQATEFPTGSVGEFRWTDGGRTLVVLRNETRREAILIRDETGTD
jgi:Tol biopolymer transport system component